MQPHMLTTLDAVLEAVTPALKACAEECRGKLLFDITGEPGRQVLIRGDNWAKRLIVWFDRAKRQVGVSVDSWLDTPRGRRIRGEDLTEGLNLPLMEESFMEIVRRGIDLLDRIEPPPAD